MILGLGNDIVEVERIRHSLEKFGDRFLQRILCPNEIVYCQKHRDPTPFVAGRFAAKEAVSKAFGTGITGELGWLDMEVCRKESGEPYIDLHGKGRQLFERRGGKTLTISLSHTHNHASAVAILEG